ncbi:MAG: hypothetical protein WCQ95_01530 [Bacteroidota bacterium]
MSEVFLIILTGIFSGSATWLIAIKAKRKKAAAEAVGIELDNADKVITIFRKLTEDLRKELYVKQEYIELIQKEHSEKITNLEKKICLIINCANRQQ